MSKHEEQDFYFSETAPTNQQVVPLAKLDFVSVLHFSRLENFQSYRYTVDPEDPEVDVSKVTAPQSLPTVPEAIVHLKLLRAFEVLKKKVVGDTSVPSEYCVKQWQTYVTSAARRFILFLTALKEIDVGEFGNEEKEVFDHGNKKHAKFISTMNDLMPPLDVIMVWHAFLLNPKSFYDVAIKNKIFHIANFPLPLHRLDQFIDDKTFEFNVPEDYQRNYREVLERVTNDSADLLFDNTKAPMYEHLVRLYCPMCKEAMTEPLPIANDSNTGFADKDFEATNLGHGSTKCYHGTPEKWTHDELRKLQLKHDITDFTPLQGTFKYFTHVICNPRFKNRRGLLISFDVARAVEDRWDDSKDLGELLKSIRAKHLRQLTRQRVLLRNYLQFNLISMTIQGGVEIGEDLVGCVLRQERFVEKMNKIDWLRSPLIYNSLAESAVRYNRFFEMITDATIKLILVPTLDIDLMWHTHQLSMYGYFRDCRSSSIHTVIDHDDKIDEGRLDDGFGNTSKIYKERYKDNYSICFCLYCTSKRTDSLTKITKFFKTKKKNKQEENMLRSHPLYEGQLSHVSAHNSIMLPTDTAKTRREKKSVGWSDNTYMMYSYPFLFVVPPVAPITNTTFYGNGLCSSVNTLCASVAGTCCNMGTCSSNGGAACVGTNLTVGSCGGATVGGTVFEIGGVCGANNNNTNTSSANCAGASGCGSGGCSNSNNF
ncbi:hypothetical protein Cantr_10424 [Candida viswanathii]|uniref:Glycine-rich domain-containing protein 1 n=1 Tax=Candida viswanathii TaxID=5486 RepID=A0A367YEG7_9ASCO|nr:hypothetical protein Cantr_10424 [Candida viswanathii]